jgi:hypothetical protein
MNARFRVGGDERRFHSFDAARRAAIAASLRRPWTSDLMVCDDEWTPMVCIGRATTGVWLLTDEGRLWAFDAGYEKGSR